MIVSRGRISMSNSRLQAQHTVTRRQRQYLARPAEVLELQELARTIVNLKSLMSIASLLGSHVDERLTQRLQDLEQEWQSRAFYSLPARHARNSIHNKNGAIVDVDSALQHPWVRDATNFRHIFRFPPEFVRRIAPVIFPHGAQLRRLRKYDSEGALLLYLARGGGTFASYATLGEFFCLDGDHCSAIVKSLQLQIQDHAENLLSVSALHRFSPHLGTYQSAFKRLIAEIVGDDPHFYLLNEFHVLLDGVRQPVARPQDHLLQKGTYSGYKKTHGVLHGGLITPCGLVAAITGSVAGHHNDKVLPSVQLRGICAGLGIKILTDSGFELVPNFITPVPSKRTRISMEMATRDTKALSSSRVPNEWSFGRIKQLFPVVFDPSKNKLMVAVPVGAFQTYCVLANLLACFEGVNHNTYYKLPPSFTPEEYYASV
jgi:hypothetical protein